MSVWTRQAIVLAVVASGCGVVQGFPIVGDDGGEATSTGGDDTNESTGIGAPPLLLLEAEGSIITGPGEVGDSATAFGMQYVAVPGTGGRHDGGMAFDFELELAGSYDLWARVLTPGIDQDSFVVLADGELLWDPWHPGQHTEWTWLNVANLQLGTGAHRVELGFREAGSRLDVIAIIDHDLEPSLPVP